MPTLKSLQEELDALKKENSSIKKRLSSLEVKNSEIKTELPKIQIEAKIEEPVEKKSDSKETVGIILIVIGALLTLTIIGAIIGIPLLIIGIIMASKKQKTPDVAIVPAVKAVRQEKEQKKTASPEIKSSIEEDIGMKWFGRIGILALVIGVGFFIKYAIDNEWVNHLTRIILGVLFGIILMVFGQIISKKEKYSTWAKTLIGGGIAMTYFVIYAAYQFTDYRQAIGISQWLDIVLLSIVVLVAIIFSLKDDSQIIAAESFFLGYMTSLMTDGYGFMTLVYGLLLTLGLVIVVSRKRWYIIGFGGMLASYFLYLVWKGENPDSFAYASFILIFYFFAFFIQSFFLLKEDKTWKSILMCILNSLFFFMFYYAQIKESYPDFKGMFVISLSVLHMVSFFIYKARSHEGMAIANKYLSLFYLTLFIPIQLDEKLVTIIWALEALVLTLLSIRLNDKVLKVGSYIVGGFAAIKTLFYDSYMLHKFDMLNFLDSTRMFSFLCTIICFSIIYAVLKKKLAQEEQTAAAIYSWASVILFMMMVFMELVNYSFMSSFIFIAAIFVLIILAKEGYPELRYQAYLISLVLFFKLLFSDSIELDMLNFSFIAISQRIAIFAFGILCFYYMSYKEQKRELFSNIYTYLASILLFSSVMIEMEEYWISIGWSIVALSLIGYGIMHRSRHYRVQGIIIFSITIFKVFIYDIRNLELIYRTVSYIALGFILLLVSFLYTKYKDRFSKIL